MDLNRQRKGKLAIAIIAVFALGCAYVFFVVGTIGGFKSSTLVGVAILALFFVGCVCGAVYIVLISITRRTDHPKQSRLPMHGGEWWIR